MHRKIIALAVVSFVWGVSGGLAQEPAAPEVSAIPAATRTEMDCSGFITLSPVSEDLYVLDGADNDFRGEFRQFGTGEYVYLKSRTGLGFAVGSEYSVVRRADEPFYRGIVDPAGPRPLSSMGNISWYAGQRWSIRSLGRPYEDVGRVKVLTNTPHGAVAEVTFACGPIHPKDLVVLQQAREIPQYTRSERLDRFALPNGKMVGAITAARDNGAILGEGTVAYINLGREDGAAPGQRYRIFRIFRENLDRGLKALPETPRETVGELVILSIAERSSVAIVTQSQREIALGDGIELQ